MTEFVLMEQKLSPTYGSGSNWNLLRITDGVASPIGAFADEDVARRIANLLNRNGLVDVPLRDIAT